MYFLKEKIKFEKGTSYYIGTPWYLLRNYDLTITLEKGITSIGAYTFYGLGTVTMKYTGTQSEWNAITKGANNTSIPATITYNATI